MPLLPGLWTSASERRLRLGQSGVSPREERCACAVSAAGDLARSGLLEGKGWRERAASVLKADHADLSLDD